MTIEEKLKFHKENFTFCKINRQVGSHKFVKSDGYILDFNEEFTVFCDIRDFVKQGYRIYSTAQILDIKYTNVEKYFDKMMEWEGIKCLVGLDFNLDISNWNSIFKSLKDNNINVWVENEKPQSDVFTVGPITKVNKLSCRVR